MAEYLGAEALDAIFEIMLDEFLRLTKLKLNGTVLTADDDKVIDIHPEANDIAYERTIGDISVTNVDEALDELFQAGGSSIASNITYDNATSGLISENVQDAIDELKTLIDGISPGGDIPEASGQAF